MADLPTEIETDVESLWQYAQDTVRGGLVLSKEPVRRQMLVEAYINSRIMRLFRMRDAWMEASGQTATYEPIQTAMWERHADSRYSQIARDVMGIYALLDDDDPNVPTQGDFEAQQRRALARQNPGGTLESYRGTVAKILKLDQRKDRKRGGDSGDHTSNA